MNAKAAKGLYADRDHWKKLSAELSDRLCEKEQQFQAIKEAYNMSDDCFDEICKHVIEDNLTGDDLEEKLNECREYDRRMNSE